MIFTVIALFSITTFSQTSGGVTQTDDQKYDGMKTNNLTDEDYNNAQNFHHEGLANKVLQEGCENSEYKDLCSEKQKAFKNNNNVIEDLIPAVSKMYGTLGLVGAGKIKTDITKAEDGSKSNKEKTDLCRFIPVAVELAVAGIQQANSNSVRQSYVDDEKKRTNQREMILATAFAHKSRKTTAKIQAVGYTSTAACYAAYAIWAGATGADTIIKGAASVGLAAFYTIKAKHHNGRKKAIEEIANQLPVIGDCNAATQTNCFCNEESSKTMYPAEYQRFCLPDEYKNSLANNPISCVDANGQVDHACNCNKTNSCLNDRLSKVNPNLTGPAAILWKESMKGFDLINSGNFDEGKLDAYSNGNKALLDKTLTQLDDKIKMPKLSLSENDKKLASNINQAGVPKRAAAMMTQSPSQTPPGLNGVKAPTIASIKKELKKSGITFENYAPGRKKIKIHSGATTGNAPKANPYAKFLNMDEKKNAPSASIEFIEYTKQAQREAEIVQRPETSIFKILSHRYKTTGHKKLKVLEN